MSSCVTFLLCNNRNWKCVQKKFLRYSLLLRFCRGKVSLILCVVRTLYQHISTPYINEGLQCYSLIAKPKFLVKTLALVKEAYISHENCGRKFKFSNLLMLDFLFIG